KAAQSLAPQLQDRVEHGGVGGAVAGGLLLLVPWVWLGALGGPLETVLAATAAAALGWLAARTTAPILRSGAAQPSLGRLVITGLAAGIALTPLAGAIGETGVALAELGVLPALGFALAFLHRVGGGPRRGTAVL